MQEQDDNIFMRLVISILVLGIIISSAIYFSKDYDYWQYLSRLFPAKNAAETTYEVTKASPDIPVSRGPAKTIPISQMVAIRKMLKEERFQELNAVLQDYQDKVEENPRKELMLSDAYRAFDLTLPSYEALLKKWINFSSGKYQPHLAIAQYYYAKGWESRGKGWAKDTSDEQMAQMSMYFSKSEKYVNRALEKKPDLVIAHIILIGIHNANGDNEAQTRAISNAMALLPFSLLVRDEASHAVQPRWGGSYEQMEIIAKDGEEYAHMNPKFSTLYGFIYLDQASYLRMDNKYDEAIELLEKALTFGDNSSFYYKIAETCYYDLKDKDRALENINKSIELRPTCERSYRLRSRIYLAQKNMIHH